MSVVKLCGDSYAAAFVCVDLIDTGSLRKVVLSGELQCCLVDASLVCSIFQVMAAVNRAVTNRQRDQMITKNIFTEIIYCLSPLTNISESLRTFSAKNDSKHVVAIFVSDTNDFTIQVESLRKYLESAGGVVSQVTDCSDTVDFNSLMEVYQVSKKELQISTMEKTVVTAMAIKHLV